MLAAASMIPFICSLGFELTNLDDYPYLVTRPLTEIWDNYESIWMPLTRLTYLADSLVWGDWWGGFHLTNLAFHAANAVLVWLILRKIARILGAEEEWVPLMAALVWAVHPLRCESVILLSSRKDVVSLFFELLAIGLWVEAGTAGMTVRGVVRYWLAIGCFLLGACCKPSVMTFPVLCFLIDAFIRREVRPFRYFVPVVLMFALGGFAAWQQSSGGATQDMFGMPLWGRVLNAAAAFGIYVRNELWPSDLAVQCIKIWPKWPRFWLPGLVISGVWGWWLWRRGWSFWDRRGELVSVAARWTDGTPVSFASSAPAAPVFAGLAWFAIAVAPMLGIASFGYHAFADRFTYIPAIGLSIALVGLCSNTEAQRHREGGLVVKSLCLCASVFIVVALGVRTWFQVQYWENDAKLYQHTLEVDGDGNTCAHGVLASYNWEITHDLEKSVAAFEKVERQNLFFIHETFQFYLFALLELERPERMGEILKAYEASIVKWFGEAAWTQAWTNEEDRGVAKQYREIYRVAKAAWWLADPKTVPLAEEYVAETQSYRRQMDPVWLYICWKLAEKKHGVGSPEAVEAKRVLSEESTRVGYAQFRYLRRDKSPRYKIVEREI